MLADPKAELKRLIQMIPLPLERWGTGPSKPIDLLVKEINEGEAQLGIVRYVWKVRIRITCKRKKKWLLLVESKEFKDGHVTVSRTMSSSEKMKQGKGERPLQCAVRAVAEELGIKRVPQKSFKPLADGKPEFEVGESKSYPGILNYTRVFNFAWEMPHRYFKKFYVEQLPHRTSVFSWKDAPKRVLQVPRAKKTRKTKEKP